MKRLNHILMFLALGLVFNLPYAQGQNQEPKNVTISVFDESTKLPIPGVNVSVLGFSSAITDDNGVAKLKVPDLTSEVIVSGKGLQSKEIPVKGRDSISVKLFEESYNSLYDIAQLPTRETTLAKSAGAISSIKMGETWKNPGENSPETFLGGKIAGLNVLRRSGMPGIGSNMYLRGISSLNCTNQPLIVVDGVPYDIKSYGKSTINNYFANPLMYLDINDIDNITIIKDATASVYGAQAANGVILITTKHPENLETKIDFVVSGGMNIAPNPIPVMNAYDYRTYLLGMITPVIMNAGYTTADFLSNPLYNDDKTNADYNKYHNNTLWQKEVFKNSYNQNYYLRVTGGDAVGKYALSVGYVDNGGAIKSTKNTRMGVRFNADLAMTKKLNIFANFSFSYANSTLYDDGIQVRTNPIYLSLIKAPFLAPNVISPDGRVSPVFENADALNIGNPSAILSNMKDGTRNYRFLGSLKADYKLTNDLELSTLLGLPFDKVRQSVFVPVNGTLPDTSQVGIKNNKMAQVANRLYSIFNDSKLTYNHSFDDKQKLEASVGIRYTVNQTEGLTGIQYNSTSDDYHNLGNGSTATGMRLSQGYLADSKDMSLYTTVDYLLLNKYFFTFNMSMDGSSRFGDNADGLSLFSKKFGVFPSIGAAWLISSEKFMQNIRFIDLMKLRASFGLTGNNDVANYSTQEYYTSKFYEGYYGMPLGGIANNELKWETNQKANVGLDIAFFNERLAISADLYRNKTKDMLTLTPVPNVSGYSYMFQNTGELSSLGGEIGINGRILNGKLKWDAGVNLSHYENKVANLPTGEDLSDVADGLVRTKTGRVAGMFYGYKTNGVFATDAEALALKAKSANGTITQFHGGDVRFIDINSDGYIDEKDRQVIGNPNPKLLGSFSSRFVWKNLTLDALVTFSLGNDIYNYQRRQLESMTSVQNQTEAILNRWQYQGQITSIPRAIYGDPMGNSRFSDRWIEDGSYARLKTITLSYKLPIKSGFIKGLTVYATGCNLVTLTKYLGFDPEFSMGENYINQGVDLGLSPITKAVYFGCKLGL